MSVPTVRTFFRALENFGGEIAAVRSASRKIEGRLTVDQAASPFVASVEDGRLAYVLEGLVDHDLVGAAYAVAEMIKPIASRIDDLLGDPDVEVREDESDVDTGTLLVLGCAERLHIDPMVIMDWPLGFFLDVTVAFSRPAKNKTSGPSMDAFIPTPDMSKPIVGGASRAN